MNLSTQPQQHQSQHSSGTNQMQQASHHHQQSQLPQQQAQQQQQQQQQQQHHHQQQQQLPQPNNSYQSSLTQTLPTNNPLLSQSSSSHQQLPSHLGHQSSFANNHMPTIPQPALMASNSILTLGPFKHRKDLTRESVISTYQIIGYIAAGTYGKVYKAKLRTTSNKKEEDISHDGKAGESSHGTATSKNGENGAANSNHQADEKADVSTAKDYRSDQTANNNVSSSSSSSASSSALPQFYAIKKFKSDSQHAGSNINSNLNLGSKGKSNHDINGSEVIHYTGISQSAIREMSLCRELHNNNITKLIDIILENKSIYMIFEFCEHDLLQIIHYHSHPEVKPIPLQTVKSLTWQILNGVTYLHKNWIFHRDLKPANIMVTSNGCVKIGDLGLARKFNNPLQSLYTGDKVVVTIWYRAPELLLGTRHYTPAIDLWAVGCILAELLSLRPIFKGEEAKIDMNNKKSVPFQKNQFQKIVDILGTPNLSNWPSINKYPEYASFTQSINNNYSSSLSQWYKMIGGDNKQCLELLYGLLKYDPDVRLTADQTLVHPFFLELPKVNENAFDGLNLKYPNRKIYVDDNDMNILGQVGAGGGGIGGGAGGNGVGGGGSNAGKRAGFDDGTSASKRKRV
ncbi:uncharacterized protein LODBEIA_P43620 [Lodderomyces beijingensis]|uniref:Cyclin-dependent kinase 8 n=1 Tax=Lodderomyces beijingensis TaxID=1775926 RepID=A0ABP0ZPQ1_9ASCO